VSSTQQWSVYIRLASEVGTNNDAHVDALIGIAAALDEAHGAAVSARNGDIDAQAWVEAPDPATALEQVRQAFAAATRQAGLAAGDVVEQHVRPWEDFANEVDTTTLPELVSGPEAAEILGVTRQRIHQLANEHPLFPDAAYELGVGRLWLRVQIETFAKRWDRRPGRRPASESGAKEVTKPQFGRKVTTKDKASIRTVRTARIKVGRTSPSTVAKKSTGRVAAAARATRKPPKGS